MTLKKHCNKHTCNSKEHNYEDKIDKIASTHSKSKQQTGCWRVIDCYSDAFGDLESDFVLTRTEKQCNYVSQAGKSQNLVSTVNW